MARWAETCRVEQQQLNVIPSTIKLHADGNITSKLIDKTKILMEHIQMCNYFTN
jgi:hypothetical protein